MKFQPGQSGNPKGRPKGLCKVAEYRAMLDPAVPDILQAVVDKAKQGDLMAARLVLDRVFPIRDAATSDLFEEIDELRAFIAESKRTDEMSVRKAKRELYKLREFIAPKHDLPQIFITIEEETEAEALARYGIDQWPEDARFIQIARADVDL